MACLKTRKKKSRAQNLNEILQQERIIEFIITRRVCRFNNCVTWQYLIKWKNLAPEYNSWEPGNHLTNLDSIVDYIEKFKPSLPISPSITHSGVQRSYNEVLSPSPPKRVVLTRNSPYQQTNFLNENCNNNSNIPPQLFVSSPYKPIQTEIIITNNIGKNNQERSLNSFPESAYLCAKSDASDLEFLDQNRLSLRLNTARSRENTDDSKVIEERNEIKEILKNGIEVRENSKVVNEDNNKESEEAKGNHESIVITSSFIYPSPVILPPLPVIKEREEARGPPRATIQSRKLSYRNISFRKLTINYTNKSQESKLEKEPSRKMLLRRAFSSKTCNT